MDFEAALAKIKDVLSVDNFKEEQVSCLWAVWQQKDLLAILPTGFGKSLIFQAVPFLLSHRDRTAPCTTIVITPINAIMMDQCRKLSSRKIPACFLDYKCLGALTTELEDSESDPSESGEISSEVDLLQVEEGRFNLVYAHPESLLCGRGRRLLKRMRKHICAIAIDEAHIILEW